MVFRKRTEVLSSPPLALGFRRHTAAQDQTDSDDADSQEDLNGQGSPGADGGLDHGAQDFVVADHRACRPTEKAGTGVEDDREAVHEAADDGTAADDDGDAD